MSDHNGTRNILEELKDDLRSVSKKVDIDNDTKEAFLEAIFLKIEKSLGLAALQEKLNILYEHEKNYLELLKNHKEEIKFATGLQEELRKERTKFFTDSLKEVSETLSKAQVDADVASVWMKELVESYTRSLDLSNSLIEENTLAMVGKIRQKAQEETQNINLFSDSKE